MKKLQDVFDNYVNKSLKNGSDLLTIHDFFEFSKLGGTNGISHEDPIFGFFEPKSFLQLCNDCPTSIKRCEITEFYIE